MSEKPINEEEYKRVELPAKFQKTFTGKLSSAGQIVVPAGLRSGELSAKDFPIPEGAKVELKIVAIHYKEE